MVSTSTTVGSIGVLAHHAPLLAMLDPTELRLYKTESEVVRFAQAEGYMQVADNRALLLVEEAHRARRARRRATLRERLQQAERELESAGRGHRAPARGRARQDAARAVPADRRGRP